MTGLSLAGLNGLNGLNALDAVVLEYVTLFPAVLAIAWSVLGLTQVIRHEWRLPMNDAWLPTVAVVVPAHNEELLIAGTIEALLAQDYPAMQLHVVCDGSTDGTARIAADYRDRGVVVHDLEVNGGKSAALQYVLDRVDTDLFLVVDADTWCHPGAIRSMVQQFADPAVGAVTGNARVGNVQNPLTAIQAMEYTVIVGMAKRAEQFWGGLYTVSGAAACLRTEALRAIGGWTVETATEDIEASWRLQRAGWQLRYEPRAVFEVQAPTRLRPLWRQRRRWARGMVEVMVMHAGFARSANRALIPIGAQVVGAGVWMLLATGMLARIAIESLTGTVVGSTTLLPTGQEWVGVLLWTLGLFGVQTAIATMLDGPYAPGGWRLVPLFVIFPIYFWVVSYPSFVTGAWQALRSSRSAVWERTERVVSLRPDRVPAA
ncbi:MAG: glycosyltransferase [Kineosporiaceae bacterium]|nr:glycosyltransferase [Kineosporiaceae bacterium]